MNILRISLFLFAILLTANCSTITVNSEYDPGVDFTNVKTYDWASIPGKAQRNMLSKERFREAVDRQLNASGLSRVQENPDFLIFLYSSSEVIVGNQELWLHPGNRRFERRGPYWGGTSCGRPYRQRYYGKTPFWETPETETAEYQQTVERNEYSEEKLILDFIDTKTKKVIWKGTVTSGFDPYGTPGEIRKMVSMIFENFPPVKDK